MFDSVVSKPIHLDVGPNLLWIVFCFALVVFSIMSLIYIYHWRRYGTGNKTIMTVEVLYVIVGVVFIGLSALFISFH